jgi:hypothetical protein
MSRGRLKTGAYVVVASLKTKLEEETKHALQSAVDHFTEDFQSGHRFE